ncbi:metal-dependent hydrolase [Halomonas heilongjiangensis]|uniref:Hydrolase n=1 Tax=Halomonas heilongjiangensis TaxID=1387883 RepID=A0A2N7TM48_9GAMM|nr:metal-dependent hydrolase [Halomonas heilongjiangensis]PMR69259.1 hydrolase [Halomonas heilongjiangensis]PXX87451.1 hydrolase [Halomonas heilongjiangensis]
MDSLTQAALGAAVGGAVLGRRLGRKAVLIGAVLGTLPDLDVVIDYGDAVANITEHRGFSHSLFVLSGLATLLALVAARFAPARDISFRRWWAFFGLCLVTHPLLDALTTYGTQLWWPLDMRPTAWPIVFIIDPLYSLPLLVGIGVALAGGNGRRGPTWGLALSTTYLVFAMGAKTYVEQRLEPVLAGHGLEEAPRLVQPTPFNTLLWRVTVVDGDRHHETLVGLLDGDTRPELETYSRGAELEPVALASRRGARLDWFAGPFLRYEVLELGGRETLVATDLRLGFPGFHPFGFTLAIRDGDEWQPLDTPEPLPAPTRSNRDAIGRLGARILSPEPALCTSDFVASHWIVSTPSQC